MVQKFYAIKSEKAVKTGTIVSTLFAVVISCGCYFLGGFGRLFDSPAIYGANGVKYDTIIPSMLATLPDVLIGIVVVLVLSASMSTLSSLVLTSSSTFTLDFLKASVAKNMNDKKTVLCISAILLFSLVTEQSICISFIKLSYDNRTSINFTSLQYLEVTHSYQLHHTLLCLWKYR